MNFSISVVIPLLNKGPHIARAIESVLKQTFQDFEIIIIDGNSIDEGPIIVQQYSDPRIHFYVQEGSGVSSARNQGVNRSHSPYIAFLDADDEWMPRHLETIIRLIKKYPDAGMFTTTWKRQTVDRQIRMANYQYIPNPPWEGLLPDYFKSGSLGDSPVWTSVVVIPKKIFEEMGGFSEGYWYGEDLDLFGKIALKYPVAFSWEFGAIYHCEALNRACDKEIPLNYQEPFITTARSAIFEGKVPHRLMKSLNNYIWGKEYARAISNMEAGYYETAQIILKQCKQDGHYIETMLLATFPYPMFCIILKIKLTYNKFVKKISTVNLK